MSVYGITYQEYLLTGTRSLCCLCQSLILDSCCHTFRDRVQDADTEKPERTSESEFRDAAGHTVRL